MSNLELDAQQWAGARFLSERAVAYLCDGVGLGKTPQFIAACDLVGAQTITVLCPPSLVVQTCREFEKWQALARTVAPLESSAGRLPRCDVLVASYAMASRDNVRDKIRARNADVLILDEAHALKTPGSQRTKRTLGKAGIATTSARVWWASGTAAPNNASEYYTFLRSAGAWTLDHDALKRRFCTTAPSEQYGLKVIGDRPEAREDLQRLLAPFVLERHGRATEAELYIGEAALTASPPDLSSIDPDALERIEHAVSTGDLATLDDPMIATARRIIGTAKAEAAAAHVLADFGGARAIIFAQHTAVIDVLRERFGAACAGVIDGRTTKTERRYILDSFSAGTSPPLLVAHIQSASEGLNLQVATRVYLVEPAWVPATNEQAIARAYRRGQTQNVYATYMYLKGTLDERVSQKLARKIEDRDARRRLMSA